MAPSEYFSLDVHTQKNLADSMPIIEARELLKLMRVSMWPNMKDKNRQEDHKRLYDQAYPREIFPRESIPLAEFIKKGGSIG